MYGYIRPGYTPPETGWYDVEDCLPLMDDGIGGIVRLRSRPVLIWLGYYTTIGYLQQRADKEFAAEWQLAGRDGYRAENVTYWRWLPPRPGGKGK